MSPIRRACIWSVASFLRQDEIADVVKRCLTDGDPCVRITALHVMADAITEGQIEWAQTLVDELETMLMAITVPCPHLFGDLIAIVALKEIHGQRHFERLLGSAPIMAVNRFSSDQFIRRGGRIPAPVHSLRN